MEIVETIPNYLKQIPTGEKDNIMLEEYYQKYTAPKKEEGDSSSLNPNPALTEFQ